MQRNCNTVSESGGFKTQDKTKICYPCRMHAKNLTKFDFEVWFGLVMQGRSGQVRLGIAISVFNFPGDR